MEQIRIEKLGKSFGVREIFSNVSFTIRQGERLALVGPNGAGKSTLMKCILGIEEHDEGIIVKDSSITIGYLQQDVNLGDASLEEEIQTAWADVQHLELQLHSLSKELEQREATEQDLRRLSYLQDRLEWLGGYDYEKQNQRIAYGLGFTDEDLKKKASEFSGGQKTRINLAKALVRRPDFLFLDEPTNHLDMPMLEWLEGYLKSYKGGIVIISHDRYFLDQVATEVVELAHHKVHTYKGNYSQFLKQREQQRVAHQRAYDKQQEHIRKTEEYIDKYRAGIKSKMARGRQSQLERLERLEAPDQDREFAFTFPKPEMSADRVLMMDDVAIGYDRNEPVATHITTTLRRGDVVGLIGANGAGKSTLVKTIMGELDTIDGSITTGNRVQTGYFSQEHEELHPTWSVLQEVMSPYDMSEESARSILGAFQFRGDDVFKLVGDLSGGERARVALLKLFLEGRNFLILDEPTNHLDIPTRETVEHALQQFEGTLLIISHDRYLLDAVAKRIIVLEAGGIEEFHGNYSYYKEKLLERSVLAAQKLEEQKLSGDTQSRKPQTSDTYVALEKENNRSTGQEPSSVEVSNADVVTVPKKKTNAYMLEKELAKVESDIARYEATIKMYTVQLQDPSIQGSISDYERLSEELALTTSKLESLYERWETLSEES
ncbi:ABC-F family ATP-binding cassette domain-containing protein [Veillonella sp. CHU740]|uniref:ABC-F family ATP-binding cassette domain-containing protein n=1 Tax=Veillonella sp. CHU740 TaxID=2490950 RepID=UPI000F8C7EE0|nr:ABC-F family ATP-binding cassette domain-containing protein [Veillonella sp. CHU740]